MNMMVFRSTSASPIEMMMSVVRDAFFSPHRTPDHFLYENPKHDGCKYRNQKSGYEMHPEVVIKYSDL